MRRIATVKYGSSTPPLERAALKIIFQFDCSDISSHPSSSLPSPTPESSRETPNTNTRFFGLLLNLRGGGSTKFTRIPLSLFLLLQAILPRRPCDRRNRSRSSYYHSVSSVFKLCQFQHFSEEGCR